MTNLRIWIRTIRCYLRRRPRKPNVKEQRGPNLRPPRAPRSHSLFQSPNQEHTNVATNKPSKIYPHERTRSVPKRLSRKKGPKIWIARKIPTSPVQRNQRSAKKTPVQERENSMTRKNKSSAKSNILKDSKFEMRHHKQNND